MRAWEEAFPRLGPLASPGTREVRGGPATGKIAVKVINHYGDEVLKVYEVADKG